jgi:hypothetical protein
MVTESHLSGPPSARAGLTLVSTLVLVTGCSLFHHSTHEASAPAATEASAAAVAPATAQAAPADVSATEAAVSGAQSAPATATAVTADAINPTAPLRYTVKRGDTLWGIASMFLKDPWLWPEVWYVNPQIQNPHLIYPGDVLALAYGADGRPQIRLEQGGEARLNPRLRSTPLDSAIPTISYGAIAAFLSRPTLVSADEVKHAPHVLAFRNEHQQGGTTTEFYVRDLDAPQGARYSVVHIGEKLKDPDSGKTLGYEGIYTATAVVERPGNPAKLVLTESARETLRGDCLFLEDAGNPLNFVPRAPASEVHGRIISVPDSVHLIGQYSIVAINRGKSHGVDAGTVLAVDQAGIVVPDRGPADYAGGGDTFRHKVTLPDERAGTVLVFKAYDDMSYALVVGALEPMQVTDVVHNP